MPNILINMSCSSIDRFLLSCFLCEYVKSLVILEIIEREASSNNNNIVPDDNWQQDSGVIWKKVTDCSLFRVRLNVAGRATGESGTLSTSRNRFYSSEAPFVSHGCAFYYLVDQWLKARGKRSIIATDKKRHEKRFLWDESHSLASNVFVQER